MNVGDRVMFIKAGKYFHPDCDIGTVVARDEHNFERPWLVRWDHGVETRPVAAFLRPAPGKGDSHD
jgi:hypothetical protein